MYETSYFFYSTITFSYTKYVVHAYTVDVVFILSYHAAKWILFSTIKKSNYMIFCRCKNLYRGVKLMNDGQTIDKVQKTKFLGNIMDNNSTWKWYIDHIADKISRGIGMIEKKGNTKSGIMSLYYSFICTCLFSNTCSILLIIIIFGIYI